MVNSLELFSPPSAPELAQTQRLLGHESAMFSILLRMLADQQCRTRLLCPILNPFKQKRIAHLNPFRSAFVRCHRLLNLSERKDVRFFFLDNLSRAYHAQMGLDSYLYHRWLEDTFEPRQDQPFRDWCAKHGCRTLFAADMFHLLVYLDRGIVHDKFRSIWQKLSPASADQLRVLMWRIIQCGAVTIDHPTPDNAHHYVVQWANYSCEI